jgi:hypothetical protein
MTSDVGETFPAASRALTPNVYATPHDRLGTVVDTDVVVCTLRSFL